MPLIDEYNLTIDLNKRGFHEEWLEKGAKRKRSIIVGIKNRIKIIKSII